MDEKDVQQQTQEAATDVANDTAQATPQEGGDVAEAGLDPAEAIEKLRALEQEVKRLRAEAAKYRVKAKQTAQEAEKAKTLEERLAELERAHKEAERRAFLADVKVELLPALGGDPSRVEAALALAERDGLLTEEGVEVDALLQRYPFLKPSEARPTDKGANPPGGGRLNPADLSQEEFERLLQRVKAGERIQF